MWNVGRPNSQDAPVENFATKADKAVSPQKRMWGLGVRDLEDRLGRATWLETEVAQFDLQISISYDIVMYHEIVWAEWTGDIGRPTIAAKLHPSILLSFSDPNGEGFPAPPIGRFKPEKGFEEVPKWVEILWTFHFLRFRGFELDFCGVWAFEPMWFPLMHLTASATFVTRSLDADVSCKRGRH